MGTDPEDDEPSGMEETERAAEMTDHIVNVTVDFMKVAERVLSEFEGGEESFENVVSEDGEGEAPSITDIACVAQLIMSGTMAGIFNNPKKKSQKSIVQEVYEMLEPLIESRINLAVSKARLREAQSTPLVAPPVPAAPEPLAVPAYKSLFDEIVEKIYKDLKECGCFEKSCKLCPDCAKRDVVREVIGDYMNKRN